MQVYKKILVTMDCSSVDNAIVEHISALALQNSAEVYLLHVVHSHTLDQDRVMHESAEKAMNVHCESMRSKGINVHIIIRSGEPDDQILREIEENGYDLLAMATHGHKFLADLLYGSVSKTLKHEINIPLLLLNPGK
jgi:nucleotide-binding universal stress UspA family protein